MMAPPASVELAARIEAGADTLVLCWEGYEEGVHLGTALGLARGEVLACDQIAAREMGHDAHVLAALRLLFVHGDVLATTPTLDVTTRTQLRELYRDYPDAAHGRAQELGLRWDMPEVGSRHIQARGDVLSTPVQRVELRLRGRPGVEPSAGFRWVRLSELKSEWRAGQRLLSPGVAALVSDTGPSLPSWAVAPHLHMLPVRTPTLPPATHTNVFVIGSHKAILIEPATPYDDELDLIEQWVGALEQRGVHLEAIAATHHHPDHVGGATALAERLQLPLWAHPATAQRLERSVTFQRLLDDGERLQLDGPLPTSLRAIHTPGHAPGHLCFVDEHTGIMIAGDMVAGVGTILVEPVDGDMRLYVDSLERMARQEPTALLPAHGGVIRDPQAWLSFYVSHRLMREQKVLDAFSNYGGDADLDDLVRHAYDDAPQAIWGLAKRSLEAHLIKLRDDGRVTERQGRWRLH